MPKYFREVNKHFSGDKEKAASYMGVARSLLGGLVEMSGDLFQNARKVVLKDGTRITVSFAGAIANVLIDARDTLQKYAMCRTCRPLKNMMVGPLNVLYEIIGCSIIKTSPERIHTGIEGLYVIVGRFGPGYLTSNTFNHFSSYSRYASDPWVGAPVTRMAYPVYLCDEIVVPYWNSGVSESNGGITTVILRRDEYASTVVKLRVFRSVFVPETRHSERAVAEWNGEGDSTSGLYVQQKIRRIIKNSSGVTLSTSESYTIELSHAEITGDAYFKFNKEGDAAVVYVQSVVGEYIEYLLLTKNPSTDVCAWTLETMFMQISAGVIPAGYLDYVHEGQMAGILAFISINGTLIDCQESTIRDPPLTPENMLDEAFVTYAWNTSAHVEFCITYETGAIEQLSSANTNIDYTHYSLYSNGLNIYIHRYANTSYFPVYGCDLRYSSVLFGKQESDTVWTWDYTGSCPPPSSASARLGDQYSHSDNALTVYAYVNGNVVQIDSDTASATIASSECIAIPIPYYGCTGGPWGYGYAFGGNGSLVSQPEATYISVSSSWAGTEVGWNGYIIDGCVPTASDLMGIATHKVESPCNEPR